MNINTLNYVGLVKQAGLFSKLLSYVKKGDKPKLLFDYEKPVPYDPTSGGIFRYKHHVLPNPRSTKFSDINDDPYTPKGAYYKQPTPEEYAERLADMFNLEQKHQYFKNPVKFKSEVEYKRLARDPRDKFKPRPDWAYNKPTLFDSDMERGTDIYRTQVFYQLMRKLNANNAIRGVKKDAYDDPRLVEKMQRYADTMVREQGYGKYIK